MHWFCCYVSLEKKSLKQSPLSQNCDVKFKTHLDTATLSWSPPGLFGKFKATALLFLNIN